MTQEILVTGRIVWGHPLVSRPKMAGTPPAPVLKDGKQVAQWSFGLAVPKADFNAIVGPAMMAEATQLFPNGVFPPRFAWKYKDGDGVDDKGKPFSAREGHAGCMVLAISTEAFQPPLSKFNTSTNRYDDFTDIKCGDYVQVRLSIKQHGANPNAAGSQAGLYLNPQGVLFLGYGTEIVSGPDAETMFGAVPTAALPPGASATPVVPVGAAPPAPPAPGAPPAPPMQQAPIAPGAVPPAPALAAPPGAPPAPPAPPPTAYPSSAPPMPPAHDFVQTVAPGVVPVAPPAPPAPVDPNAPQIVRYDGATGKPVWRWPDGREALGN